LQLIPSSFHPHRRKPVVLAAVLALTCASPAWAFTLPQPPANVGVVMSDEAPDRVHVAQSSQEAAQLAVRIQQLEEQIRSLNGQVEGLTFQLTQMQTLIQRMTEDNEFRFQALEGGAPGKTEAATQPGGATPPEALPQDPTSVPMTDIPEQGVRPLPGEAEFDPTFTDGGVAPVDPLGTSGDPLVGTGGGPAGTDLATGQPLNLSFDPAAAPTGNVDADAQYAAGYEAIVRGDYEFAEEQFSQFLALYPDNPRSADASNWLGEALFQRSAYDQAAEVLLTAYQKSPDGPRAPDLLLKLGMSLAGAGEREVACRTYAQVEKSYVNVTPAFTTRLAEEKTKAECPPA